MMWACSTLVMDSGGRPVRGRGGWDIQGDSGGKIATLGGDSISRCEKRSSYKHVSNSEWLPRWSCLNLARTVLPYLF
jgi:hypothetical protein